MTAINVDSGHQKGVAEADIIIGKVLPSLDQYHIASHSYPGHWVTYDLIDHTSIHVYQSFLLLMVLQLALLTMFFFCISVLLADREAAKMQQKRNPSECKHKLAKKTSNFTLLDKIHVIQDFLALENALQRTRLRISEEEQLVH